MSLFYKYTCEKKNVDGREKKKDMTFCWFNPGKEKLIERKRTIDSW